MEKLIIIGSGPAGLSAGIYAARAGLQPCILEGLQPGGQLMQTQHVANYPGIPETVPGPEVISRLRTQAEQAGARFVTDEVLRVDFSESSKKLFTLMGDQLEACAVIVATGAGVTRTGRPGEAQYWGRGISACLTCDGGFYVGRHVVLVGEGAAVTGATRYLEGLGVKVVAAVAPQDVAAFEGDGAHLAHVALQNGERIATDGVFLLTARRPQTAFLGDALEMDAAGHIVAHDTHTSVAGVFAAGDCARARLKQAIIAAGDGAIAALEAQRFLSTLNKEK